MSQELFLKNLNLIQKIVDSVCRRQQLHGDKREEFASFVNLKLIDNDYAILRKHRGEATIGSYLTTVVTRLGLDFRNQEWGRWRPSVSARRLGAAAVQLETLVYRDGHTFSEALKVMARRTGVNPDSPELESLLEKLPGRLKRRFEDPGELESMAAPTPGPEALLVEEEKGELWDCVQEALSRALSELERNDRLMIKMNVEDGLTWTRIASILGQERRVLYRRKEKVLRRLRGILESEGYDHGRIDLLLEGF